MNKPLRKLDTQINYSGDYEDSLIVEADTIEEVREHAYSECSKRGWDAKDCWSEKLDD